MVWLTDANINVLLQGDEIRRRYFFGLYYF
jgi:hypothetical protein